MRIDDADGLQVGVDNKKSLSYRQALFVPFIVQYEDRNLQVHFCFTLRR